MLHNLAYTGVLLGVLVFVHELGHFLVAKACGVKVLKFSLGFGPRIFGFQRGDTEYRLSWLPLGGYVKMAGEQPFEELSPAEAKRGFLAQSAWKRAMIVAAGPVFNLVFPVLVYFFVFVGTHETISTRIASVEPGLPAAEAHLQPGDQILAVDGQKVETFDELRSALQPRYDKEISLDVDRDGHRFVAHLTPAKNVETNVLESVPRGMIGISQVARAPVVGVPPGSIGEKAGLRSFDQILAINGQPTKDEVALREVLKKAQGVLSVAVLRNRSVNLPGVPAQVPETLTLKMERQAGEGFAALGVEGVDLYVASVVPGSPAEKVGVHAGDRLLSVNGKELKSFLILQLAMSQRNEAPFTLGWRSGEQLRTGSVHQVKSETKDELGQVTWAYDLGLRPWQPNAAQMLSPDKITVHWGVLRALSASLHVVPEIIAKTLLGLYRLVTLSVPLSSVGGPIMMYQLASRSAEAGLDMFLNLMAVISINLGLMNLLPIPILDGFHLLAALWEGVRRRPIPARAREVANWVGLAMLLALMVLVFKNDITRVQ